MLQEDFRARDVVCVDTLTQQDPKVHLRCLNIRKQQYEAFIIVPSACLSHNIEGHCFSVWTFLKDRPHSSRIDSSDSLHQDLVCRKLSSLSWVLVLRAVCVPLLRHCVFVCCCFCEEVATREDEEHTCNSGAAQQLLELHTAGRHHFSTHEHPTVECRHAILRAHGFQDRT